MNNPFATKTPLCWRFTAQSMACSGKEKMVLQSNHCENSEIYWTIEGFQFLNELQSSFTYTLQMKSWTETVLPRMRCSNPNLVIYMCKDEVKRENVSLSITLNHNPKCNISTLCYISVKLFRKTALWRRPVTSLGHQGGRRVFWEGTKFFKLCPIILNYAQHIFTSGAENFLGWLRVPGYGPAVTHDAEPLTNLRIKQCRVYFCVFSCNLLP